MQLEGGINVTHGEKNFKQPFRVCVQLGEDNDGFWTNEKDEAMTIFEMLVKRQLKGTKR